MKVEHKKIIVLALLKELHDELALMDADADWTDPEVWAMDGIKVMIEELQGLYDPVV